VALNANLRGALYMAIAMAALTTNDTLTKSVLPQMGMGQVILLRGVVATSLLCILIFRTDGFPSLKFLAHRSILTRVACEIGGTTTFIFALAHLPLANVTAVLQALPLAVTMGAAIVLAEPVGWRRWSAISVGFVGVMIIVRPGLGDFSAWSLLALLTVGFCAVRDLSTRLIPQDIPSVGVSVATSAGVTLSGAALLPFTGGWQPVEVPSALSIFLAGILVVVGYQFVIKAMRQGDISFMAPFRYTSLLWAILLGFLFFGDVPDALMLFGSALVVGSGLYALYRERIVGHDLPITESTAPAITTSGLDTKPVHDRRR